MNSLMVTQLPSSDARLEKKSVALDAPDAETLLVDWLSELAYWAETDGYVFHKFEFYDVSATHVRASLYGRRAAQLDRHIKAVTYHNLEIVRSAEGFTATVVFDV
jgi:SHS2 domain-containing protein